MNSNEQLGFSVKGHVKITDDLGNVLLDKDNAIHPQNMARIIARALANEPNSHIYRMAFGNGGTQVDSAYNIRYMTPNDGQEPDKATWESRLYRETYSEVVDDGLNTLNPDLGKDLGSADSISGIRPGGGSFPEHDPATTRHVSGPGVRSKDMGIQSTVIITCVLNEFEPRGQHITDNIGPNEHTEMPFTFDEIGLYSGGSQALSSHGYQFVNIGNRSSIDDSGLIAGQTYSFNIATKNTPQTTVSFTVPANVVGSGPAGQITYGDLCEAINTGNTAWGLRGTNPLPDGVVMRITDNTKGIYPSIIGSQTFGYLMFENPIRGANSHVDLTGNETTRFLSNMNRPAGGVLLTPVSGTDEGGRNNPLDPASERERLLTHIIFSPIAKTSNRVLTVVYTLTISVARTVS